MSRQQQGPPLGEELQRARWEHTRTVHGLSGYERPDRWGTGMSPSCPLCSQHGVVHLHPSQCVLTHGASGVGTPRRKHTPRTYTRHPVLDRVVKVSLIFVWLMLAASVTSLPVPIMLVVWIGQAWVLHWLWRQYRHQTSPTHDRPAVVRQPGLPILVRLCLLPGATRIFGPPAVHKARALRALRRDQARHPELAAKVRRELATNWSLDSQWADNPGVYRHSHPSGQSCPHC